MDYSKLSDEAIELLLVEKLNNIVLRQESIENKEIVLKFIEESIEQLKELNHSSDVYINQLLSELEQAKQSNSINDNSIQQIADKLKHYITQPANTISNTKGKRKTARQMIEEDRFKKGLKRKSKD